MVAFRDRILLGAVLMLFGCLAFVHADCAASEGPEDVVKHCARLSFIEAHAYIDGLGKAKRFDDLAAIYHSGVVSNGCYAATVHVRELDADRALALCRRFEIGSLNWDAAAWGLTSHPRTAVIGYLKQAATSSLPMVRASCYRLCMSAEWGDLVDLAKDDVDCDLPLVGIGWQPRETLGSLAAAYRKRFLPK